jgi:glycosyltransferase involved in cell wall biosynthesis
LESKQSKSETFQPRYRTQDLAILIPSKDRPKEVERLLQSIVSLDCIVGRVIIVASGQDIQEVMMKFKTLLPLEYYRSEPGQIKQRNLGIAQLDEKTRLVATMNDDVMFHKDTVSKMIAFWNSVEPETAGVGFNIVNRKAHHHSWLKGFFGVSVPEPGRVLKSGINTPITNVKESIRSEWLNGGATVWRQEILKTHPHREIQSRWAIYEDLIFSYPLGRKHPLYVCHGAQVKMKDVAMQNETPKLYEYQGKSQFLWGLYFVLNNNNLSVTDYLLYKLMQLSTTTMKGLIFRDYRKLHWAAGILSATYLSFGLFSKKNNIVNILESNT